MLELKRIRNNPEEFKKQLELRGDMYAASIDELLLLDQDRRTVLQDVEALKQKKNEVSKMIGELKRKGEDASSVMKQTEDISESIKTLDNKVSEIDFKMHNILISFPNVVHSSVKKGADENDNELIREVGEPTGFTFEPKPHYELAEELEIIDFESASKIVGSRFATLKKDGARLERALINFMLNLHTEENGYTEIMPPYFVNRDTMTKAGKLPKFEDDAFKIFSNHDWFLNSTAEVPLVGHFADDVIPEEDLPIKIAGYTTAFRKESGSAGRDTRGLMRLHQFNKVELFALAHPDKSYELFDIMVSDAEKVLKLLKLPYRVVSLCSGDLGDGNAITYDLEVWIPSQNAYREISSVSNAESFQSIRGNIKYRDKESKKLNHVHILNGSGLAVGRTMLAIMENYQNEDGSITIPDVLIPYMGKDVIR